MQKYYAVSLLVVLILSGLTFTSFSTEKSLTKRQAIRQINSIKREADMHQKAIKKIRTYAKKASCCYEYFVIYARGASEEGTSTLMFVELAKATSQITEPRPMLKLIPEVIGSPKLGYAEFEELLKMAIRANTAETTSEVRWKIDSYRE